MLKKNYILNFIIDAKFNIQNKIFVISVLGLGGVFDSVWRGGYPPERNTAWNKGRKCFHCLGTPNNLIRPWPWRLKDVLLGKQKYHNEQLAHPCHLVSVYKMLVPSTLAPIPHTIVGLFYHLRFKHTRNWDIVLVWDSRASWSAAWVPECSQAVALAAGHGIPRQAQSRMPLGQCFSTLVRPRPGKLFFFLCRIHLWFRWLGVCRQSRWRHTDPSRPRWRVCVTTATLWQQQDGGYT